MIHLASPQSRPAVIVTYGQTDLRTYERTLCVKIVITTFRDCGRPRGAIFLKKIMYLTKRLIGYKLLKPTGAESNANKLYYQA